MYEQGKKEATKHGLCTPVNTFNRDDSFYMRHCRHSINRRFFKMQFHFTFPQGLSAEEILSKCQINSFSCATWNVLSFILNEVQLYRLDSINRKVCFVQDSKGVIKISLMLPNVSSVYSALHFESASILFSKRTRFEHFV